MTSALITEGRYARPERVKTQRSSEGTASDRSQDRKQEAEVEVLLLEMGLCHKAKHNTRRRHLLQEMPFASYSLSTQEGKGREGREVAQRSSALFQARGEG